MPPFSGVVGVFAYETEDLGAKFVAVGIFGN